MMVNDGQYVRAYGQLYLSLYIFQVILNNFDFDLNMYHQFFSRINEAMPFLYLTDISVASFRLENSQCQPCIRCPRDQSSLIWSWQSLKHGFHMIPFHFPCFFLGVHQAKATAICDSTMFFCVAPLHGRFSFSLMGQGKPIQTN